LPRFAPRSEHLRSPDCACNPGRPRSPDIASLIRATTNKTCVVIRSHTPGKRQGGVRFARYYVPMSQFEHAGSEGLGCQSCILRGSLANARSRLRMTKLVVGGGTSHGSQDGSGAGAAVRPRSPAARGVERDNRRHRFGIAHSVRVIQFVMAGEGPGSPPRTVASHRGHGYLCVGRLPRAASVAFGRSGERAVEPGSNREPSRWLPPSRRNCLW
jgi:hypothetical protein